MAQVADINNIDDFVIYNQVGILRLGIVYEGATNPPYVGMFMEMQALGESDFIPSANTLTGTLFFEVTYTDNTSVELAMDADMFANVSAVTQAASRWFIVRGDGKVAAKSEPTASTALVQSSSPSANERIALDATKQFRSADMYWLGA